MQTHVGPDKASSNQAEVDVAVDLIENERLSHFLAQCEDFNAAIREEAVGVTQSQVVDPSSKV